MNGSERTLRHLRVLFDGISEPFSGRGGGSPVPVPHRNVRQHATRLENQYRGSLATVKERRAAIPQKFHFGERGAYLEFDVVRDKSDALAGLEDKGKDVELVSLRRGTTPAAGVATIFVPEGGEEIILRKIQQYKTERVRRSGKPKNEPLVARINDVRAATVRSLWTDAPGRFPSRADVVWWEAWLRKRRADAFQHAAESLGVTVVAGRLAFPERDVKLVRATREQMQSIMDATDSIAELRSAKDSPATFLQMRGLEQSEWASDIATRITTPGDSAPAVCILDSGVNRDHPLLTPLVAAGDLHSYLTSWGVHDTEGHGTGLAGLAAYGDLYAILVSQDPIILTHVLESAKILPPTGQTEPHLYGIVTTSALSLAEIAQPFRRRVVCLAITSNVEDYHGRPSSWSSTLDQLCYGDEDARRGFVVSAGNYRENIDRSTYLAVNDTAEIEDPAQAWNALTVGAYTEKAVIADPSYAGWSAVAPPGDLSPRSRTSVNWDTQWPIKPDVVFEGGNFATQPGSSIAQNVDDLSLITTYDDYRRRLFTDFGDTSSAAALGARFEAQLMHDYPNLRPETIRGLVVHSAEWTTAMLAHARAWSAVEKGTLLRRYGYGVPNLARASRSARNDLTLLIEGEIQPFVKDGSRIRGNEMKLHALPWPLEELEPLAHAESELRVTLSYYVEPNPGERGWLKRHKYASHSLRFDVKRASETVRQFRRRLNAAVVSEESGSVPSSASARSEDARWRLGEMRNKGSLHSDYWTGTAADLAHRGVIAVYPVSGWWKENAGADAWSSTSRYSLIVSLRVPSVNIDIYTPVAAIIQSAVPITIGL